jgi:hypothetical protein
LERELVWEPCAGHGDLIDGVLQATSNVRIRASEISEQAVNALERKYQGLPNVEVCHEDALEVGTGSLFDGSTQFSRVLANPPYGAYLPPERRTLYKKRYPKLYVKESYSLLLYHSLLLTSPGGRVVFILPDTFLWLNRHEYLRRTLVTKIAIEEIALFPSTFFPGISFGYSGMCIITAVKTAPGEGHHIRIVHHLANPSILLECAEGRYPRDGCSITEILQNEIAGHPHAELIKPAKDAVDSMSTCPGLTLEDIAEVRTGFYSGNDRRWIRRAHARVPRSRHYRDIDRELVCENPDPPLDGIATQQCFIPILRGGAANFNRPSLWYVDWSLQAVREYRRAGNNPARLQYYFREGIGVPMVASARLTAAPLNKRLFDQGIVGIFSKDEKYLLYLLGFLNTGLATTLLRKINPTANNSANYLKRLPIVLPEEPLLEECNTCVRKAIEEVRNLRHVAKHTLQELEVIYRRIWGAACAR